MPVLALVLVSLALAGCASPFGLAYKDLFVNRELTTMEIEGEETTILAVPFVAQQSESCCGLAVLAMVLDYWVEKPHYAKEMVEKNEKCPANGLTGAALKGLAEARGFEAAIYKGGLPDLFQHLSATRPLIVMLQNIGFRHYVVVVGHTEDGRLVINDPAKGTIFFGIEDFMARWKEAKFFTMLVVPRRQS